jgi:hypothetical protein
MTRRDAFSMLRGTQPSTTPIENMSQLEDSKVITATTPITPLDFIPMAEPRKKIKQKWKMSHHGEITTYRGIPLETHQTLINLANSLGVPVDEVVRALLEFGIAHYRSGELVLIPHPKSQRMTLFPDGLLAPSKPQQNWLHEAFPLPKSVNRRKKKSTESKLWEARVTYRLPPSLKLEIKQIANTHTVGVGELVLFFFKFGLEAFESGQLKLEPHLKVVGNTLF